MTLLNKIIGFIFIFASLGMATEAFELKASSEELFLAKLMHALVYFIIGTLIFPPIRNFIFLKTRIVISTTIRIIIIFLLFLIIGNYQGNIEEIEKEIHNKKLLKIEKQNVLFFNENRDKILLSIRKDFNDGELKKVVNDSKKYLSTGDKELLKIFNDSKDSIAKLKTRKILNELKNIPASNYIKNKELYKELVSYNPSVKEYKDKFNFYSQQIQKEKDKGISISYSAKPASIDYGWLYSQKEDLMGKGTNYTAIVFSSNVVNLGFPYSGEQHGRLMLRTHPRYGKDIIFSIEKGQILCNSYENCTVLVRFDDENGVRFSASGSADNSSETIFIRNYRRFVNKMLKAKRVRIAANIYQEGAPVFEFNVTNFEQKKYKPKK